MNDIRKGEKFMDCCEFNRMLDNYAGLTDAELSELEKHAAECEACRGELEFFRSIMDTTAQLPVPEPPLDLIDKVNSRIDRIPAATRRLDSLKNGARAHIRPIMTIAACLAVGLVVGLNHQAIRDRLTDNSTDGVISTTVSVTDSEGKDIDEYEINEVPEPVVEDPQPVAVPEQKQPAALPVIPKTPAATAAPAKATAKPAFKPSAERVTLPVITQAPAVPAAPAAPTVQSKPAVSAQPAAAPATITASAPTAEPEKAAAESERDTIMNSRYRIARGNYHIPETAMATAEPTAAPKSAEVVKEEYQIAMGTYEVTEEEKAELLQNKLIVSEADIKEIVDCMNKSRVRGTTTGYVASSSAFANFLAMLDAKGLYYNFIQNTSGTDEIKFVLLAN